MTKNPEQTRFVESYKVYLENSRGMSRPQPGSPVSAAGGGGQTKPTAKANKTIATRRSLYGSKATTGAGIQSIKKAGITRTNSTKKP